jgi:hypothetical protein
MLLLLLACAEQAPVLQDGTYSFELDAIVDDTCGMSDAHRSDVALSGSEDRVTTLDEEGLEITYAVAADVLTADYTIAGDVAGGGCAFDIHNTESGTILSETSFSLEVDTELGKGTGSCTLPLPCAMTARWSIGRTAD